MPALVLALWASAPTLARAQPGSTEEVTLPEEDSPPPAAAEPSPSPTPTASPKPAAVPPPRRAPRAESPLHFDVFANWSKVLLGGIPSAEATALANWGGGFTLGYRIGRVFLVGATSDFRRVIQTSEAGPMHGNYRGTRWNALSPVAGAFLGRFLVKADLQFLGSYVLSNDGPGGSTVSYDGPAGLRASVSYRLLGAWHVGAYGESISFRTVTVSGLGRTELEEKLRLRQLGLAVTYVF